MLKSDPAMKYAVDIKTTYRLENCDDFCNGFTLGSHGEHFQNRAGTKNVQFPCGEYREHLCLGIICTRTESTAISEQGIYAISDLTSITSVISDLQFFAQEKWRIASDRSGNTTNIGSIDYIPDLLDGRGVFVNPGEWIFDEYRINHGILRVPDARREGHSGKLAGLDEFPLFKGMDISLIHRRRRRLRP